jgi:GNAT superfamily N-acetyltransferase
LDEVIYKKTVLPFINIVSTALDFYCKLISQLSQQCNMTELKMAAPEDWQTIQTIAYHTWPHTFGEAMPKEQIDYMLALIYNEQSLKQQMITGRHQFLLTLNNADPVGFASYELNYRNAPQLMIHKIYLLPQSQGLGIGTKIFDYLTGVAKRNEQKQLRLKVFYKNEKTAGFYRKYGFTIAGTESADIGNGYIILDNVMEMQI